MSEPTPTTDQPGRHAAPDRPSDALPAAELAAHLRANSWRAQAAQLRSRLHRPEHRRPRGA
jgi:hypothetical protein